MPLPGGLSTFTLTFGPDWDVDGGDPAFEGMVGHLSVSPAIVDLATGESLVGPIKFVIGNDGTASIGPLVANDDPGVNQGTAYTVTWDVLTGVQPSPGSKTFVVHVADGSTIKWNHLVAVTGTVAVPSGVASVNGHTGAVTLAKADVGLGNVDNTSDVNKPVSTAQQTALNAKVSSAGLDTAVAGVVTPGGSATAAAVAADPALRAAFDMVLAMPAPSGVAATDTTNLAALLTKAQAVVAGGGRALITFPAGTYNLPAGLSVVSGVSYRGVAPTLTQQNTGTGYMPDGEWTYVGGTVLQGDHTGDAIHGNTTPAGSAVDGVFGLTQISGVSIYGFGGQGYVNGLNIGATNVMGLVFSSIDALYFRDCTGWGVRMLNFQHMNIGYIRTSECLTGGQYWASEVALTTLIPGNSSARELFHKSLSGASGNAARGIVIGGFNATSPQLGGFDVDKLQHNAYNRTLVSQTATLTNGSANIAVTDGTKFAVGMPVSFTATGDGFTASNIYVVKTVSGNTLTLATSQSGTAITATGSGTLTIQTYGFAACELVNVGSAFIHNFDLEGNSSVALYLEGTQYSELSIRTAQAGLVAIVGRNSPRMMFRVANSGSDTDFDSTTVSQLQYFGGRNRTLGYSGRGLWFDGQLGTSCLQIGDGLNATPGGDIQVRRQGFLYPGAGMGERIFPRDTALTLAGFQGGDVVFNGGTGVTFTLPTIVTDSSNPGLSHVGLVFDIVNVSSNSLTVATDGTQLFNKVAAKTSLTVPSQGGLKVIGAKDNSGNLFWIARAYTLA